ncbi:MAG: hypothetical protein LBP67_06665 [Bacteroidales bacterium]|jgi:hypothetical protein|nr:hypothetical protein [Bacteroidales bacterium]
MKKIGLFFLIIIAYCTFSTIYAQTIISGKISNQENKSVPNVSVTLLRSADSTIIAYNIGDVNGEYTIYYSGQEKELLLAVYGFNVKRQIKKIINENQVVDFVIIEEAIELGEVVIKADKIWGGRDTINYAVESFRDSTDIVIADVLKRMPGIEVKESGIIEYRGKPISKFYIENMDMLQGRYGIATNNISAADVATVQVLENHQPIKTLQDIDFTDDVALNIKLKDGAKGIYSIMADLGVGIDFNSKFLWDGGLTGMYFGKRRQNILSYKTNNSGNDIYKEFQSHLFDENIGIQPLSSIIMPSPPQINKNRYYFNQGHGLTFNTLLKSKMDDEFIINLVGYIDVDDRNSQSNTIYFIPGEDTVFINEKLISHTSINKLEGDFTFKRNNEKNYLINTLKFDGSWENSNGNIFTDELIEQEFNHRTFKASNIFNWIKTDLNKKGIEIDSKTYFQSQPYQLTISPGVFNDILNDSTSYNAVEQDILFTSFETHNAMRFLSSLVWKFIRVNPALFLSIEHQSLNSDIYTALTDTNFILLTNDSLNNDISWLRAKAGGALRFDFNYRGLSAWINLPLSYQYISLLGEEENHQKQHKLLFQPSLRFKYLFSSRWELIGSWNYYNSSPNLSTLYSGYILQNYRTLSRYENRLSDSYGNFISLKLSYKNIMDFIFADIEFSYNNYRNEVMYAQEFEGALMKIHLVELENKGNYIGLTGRLNKGFNWKKLSFNAMLSWGKGNTPLLRQDQLVKYINQGINTNLIISLAITNKIGFANKLSLSRVAGIVDGETTLDPMINLINAANLDFTILKNLTFSASFEYYYIKNAEIKQNFYLFDIGIMYNLKRIRLRLEWDNIFNTKSYIYSYYGNLSTYYSEYIVRPSSIMLKVQFKLL